MSDYPTSQQTRVTVTSTTVTATRPQLDFNYVKTLPGILRIVEIALSIIVFICSVSGCSWHSHAGFGAFVGFVGFILVTALLVLSVMHVFDSYPQIPWILFELIFYAIWTFFFLVAGSCLAALASYSTVLNGILYYNYCRGAAGAGSFFAFAAMLVFGIDTFFKFREWRSRITLARGGVGGGPSAWKVYFIFGTKNEKKNISKPKCVNNLETGTEQFLQFFIIIKKPFLFFCLYFFLRKVSLFRFWIFNSSSAFFVFVTFVYASAKYLDRTKI